MIYENPQPIDPKAAHFFVGVGKCGTSWLYEFLKRHDLVSVPTLKEPYLIGETPERQAEIIGSLYSGTKDMADFSTLYYWDAENPQKILHYNPDARIFITTRLPSKRILSHFGFLRRNGLVREETVAEYLTGDDPEAIVARSRYREMIARYQDVFGPHRVIVLPLEQLEQDPQGYADRLCDFLDVRRVALSEVDIKPVLAKARARSLVIARLAKVSANGLRRFGMLSLLGRLKSSALLRSILFKDVRSVEEVDFSTRAAEIAQLDTDYAKLLRENGVELAATGPAETP